MRGGKERTLKKYIVKLEPEEREELLALTRKGQASARTLKRAMVLLSADEGEAQAAIAAKLRLHGDTVADISRRFVEGGIEAGYMTGRDLVRQGYWRLTRRHTSLP